MQRMGTLGMLLVALVLVACQSSEQGENTSGTVTSEEVKEKAAAAVKAATEFAQQKKDEFRKQMEAQLAELDEKIGKLNAKVAELGAAASQDLKDMVETIHQQAGEARQQLVELGSATGANVEALKENIDKRIGDLKASYEKAESSAP